MKRLYFLILIVCSSVFGFSQRYGQEWINYSQRYYKFPLTREGLYRIDSLTLSNYFNLSQLDPAAFQLWLKGKEIRLYISGGSDGKINTNDFIEFYADPMPAEVDSLLYKDISYLPNPYWPLFNDTINAFLTAGTNLNNKRYTLETDTNTAGHTVGDHFYSFKFQRNFVTPATGYNMVDLYDGTISDPNYTQAEGKGFVFYKGGSANTSFALQNYTVNPALPFYVKYSMSGFSRQDGAYPDHKVTISYLDANNNNILLHDTTFFGYVPVHKTFTLSASVLPQSPNFTVSSIAVPGYTFNNATLLNYVSVYHPQSLALTAQSFYRMTLDNNSATGKTFFNFSNLGNPLVLPAVLLDLNNGKRVTTVVNGIYTRALIPNGALPAECLLAAEHMVTKITSMNPVNGNGLFIDYRKPVIKAAYLMIYPQTLQSSAQTYSAYRSSIAGGSHDVIGVRVDQLYDQFAFGVNKHPLAIKNFVRLMYDSLQIRPAFLLLLGKGIKIYDLDPGKQSQNLVPTIGIPSSDNLFATAIDNNNHYAPQIAVGRIAATTNAQVLDYLDKVKEHESSGKQEWKKKVLHFVGGNDEDLNNRLSTFMSSYEQIIKDTLFGGKVYTFKKNTTAPIQSQISDSIISVVSSGASLFNFFGHGSDQGFDQAIDDPEMFRNAGRYPFIIANSCYSGNTFVYSSISISERFVFAKQKGSIGFIATSSFGLDQGLDQYTQRFYRAIGKTHYGRAIGDVVKEACYQTSLIGDPLTPIVGMEMTLHADPAIVISVGDQPDYQLNNNNVSFDISRYTDSIGVLVKLKNVGKAVADSLGLRLTRYMPGGDSVVIIKTLRPLMYEDTFKIFIFTDFDRGIGLNKFKVAVDYARRIAESDEFNNSTFGTVDVFIPGGDVLPVYPYKYAIIPNTKKVTLKASTADPFAPSARYIMQLDTSDAFTAPFASTLITSKGGVLEWAVNLPYGDSTVYFWRVSRDSVSLEKGYAWRQSSFQLLGEQRGWGQSQFQQFRQNSYQFVTYKAAPRKFVFENTSYAVMARTGIIPNVPMPYVNSYFNNVLLDAWSPMFNGWNLAVFDSASGQPWLAVETGTPFNGAGQYGNCASQGGRGVFSFGVYGDCQSFPADTATWKVSLRNFINGLPKNVYVMGYSTGWLPPYSAYSTYSTSLYTAFESLGLGKIRTTKDSVGYAFFGKKGMSPGQAHEVVGANKKTIVYISDTVKTAWNSGFVASPLIGPSFKWNEIQWRTASVDQSAGDTTILKVVGYQRNGNADTLLSIQQNSNTISNLDQYIDAEKYRHIKLVALMKDNVYRSSPQLKYWRVLYDEAPECAINPLKGFSTINDTVQEGDVVEFRFPIENISHRNFNDSLVISYWLEDNNRNKVPLPDRLKKNGFAAGEIIVDSLKLNSYQLKGNNTVWLQVNPINHKRYQPEQEQYNNIGRYAFSVKTDQANPLLDVTFDGVRILNGDIVSARPEILITLRDENKFLALNDTSAFAVYLQSPSQSGRQRIYFAEGLDFTPASLPKNSAVIRYHPVFTQDGRYTLSVQAKDRSANKAGNTDYVVQFEIVNKPGITQVMNYPNPFTTSTRFVFTLTGSDVPEIFTIQIMTITGKIVREITRAELGHLHVGRNMTDYAWDGRDEYGDRLANGVYLYRINVRLNGTKMDLNATGADQYFTKEIGKMVLFR